MLTSSSAPFEFPIHSPVSIGVLFEVCLPAMSMSKNMSPEHDRELQFLKTLQNEGRLQALLCEMQVAKDEIGLASTGSMHDGSKRRLDSWEEFDLVSEAQSPVMLKMKNSKAGAAETHPDGLPPGVTSLKQWGDTLNTMGKYAGLNLSYNGMVAKAKKDAEAGDPAMQDYLKWVTSCSAKQSPKGADFAAYLKAIKWGGIQAYGECFPGTTERRQFIEG